MPAATTKTELLSVTEKEYEKLAKLIRDITDDVAMEKREEDTSLKDVVAHRAHWISLFLGWYADGQAGREVHFPAKGYKWNDLKRYNADLRARQSDMTWADARADLAAQYTALVAFMSSASQDTLYSGPMKGARNDWTPGRWAEAAGASHFRSAAKYIRSVLRSLA